MTGISKKKIKSVTLTDKELRKLCRWMTASNPLKRFAESLLQGREPKLGDPVHYLTVLDAPSPRGSGSRLLSAEALRFTELTPELAARAELTLKAIVANRQVPRIRFFTARTFNMFLRAGLFMLVAILIVFVDLWLERLGFNISRSALFWPMWLAVVSTLYVYILFINPFVSFAYDRRRQSRLRQLCATALGRWGGRASIEALLTTANDDLIWQAASPSLRTILTKLEPDDYGHVSSRAIEDLAKLFQSPRIWGQQEIWIPLLLDTLEKTGTGACVNAVQNVADNASRQEWKDHAARVLPVLLERQKRERDSSRLLRPTTTDESQDVLLRPVIAAKQEDDLNLLRAIKEE